MEYIEREAIVNNSMLHTWKKADLLKAIKDAPSVDVAPVRHGRWIEHEHYHHEHYIDSTYECSECNAEELLTSEYCPNCGAKMDLEDTNHGK